MDENRRSKLLKELDDMTMSHKQNIMQIAAFQTTSDDVYGINIAKIKEFAMIKDAQVTRGLSENPYQMGIAVLRGESFPIVNLTRWLGSEKSSDDDFRNYDIFIVCEFNQSLVAFPVKKILMIASKNSEELERPSTIDAKITYVTKIQLNQDRRRRRRRRRHGKHAQEAQKQVLVDSGMSDDEAICFVLDVEQMLEDVFPEITASKIRQFEDFDDIAPIDTNKMLVICEDSEVASSILHKTLDRTKVVTHYFSNGLEFKAWVAKNHQVVDRIGCVITDIEMPMMDGFKVVDFVKSLDPKIPIIVNTSMSNIGVIKKLEDMGVDEFIPKTEPLKIYKSVKASMEGKHV
ncbi:MAG: chemotaxis protein CheW [Sulfurimonadaceae bacterium]|nr:chemotaxis protein CheW [Sulfurimonadaceae bacterium]